MSIQKQYKFALKIYEAKSFDNCFNFRSQCMGVITLMIRLGACSAPWVAQWLQHIHHTLPFAILGGAVFLAGILCTQLPETRGKPTAETLEDAVKK